MNDSPTGTILEIDEEKQMVLVQWDHGTSMWVPMHEMELANE